VPPRQCPPCLEHAKKSVASGPYQEAPDAWWCTQRSYLYGLSQFLAIHPDKDYYFLADANTAIFPLALRAMMQYLDFQVLKPTDDLYMGHGFNLKNMGPELPFQKFIMSGGGVLLRGLTLRRLAATGVLEECAEEVYNGTWCYHHLDWFIGECLSKIGVYPQGHPAFQQHIGFCKEYPPPWHCCHEAAVACHPVEEGLEMLNMIRMHTNYLARNLHTLSAAWATPCKDENFEWMWRHWGVVSICNGWGYKSLYYNSTVGVRNRPRDFR